jgi:hypothetical protein
MRISQTHYQSFTSHQQRSLGCKTTFAPMAIYMAVYSNNELLTLREMDGEVSETIQMHNNGLLIYACVQASSYNQAYTKADRLGLRFKESMPATRS